MSADDFLRRLVSALNEADIKFMVIGSFASSFRCHDQSPCVLEQVVVGESSLNLANKEGG